MNRILRRAAIIAALLHFGAGFAAAQDVSLIARDGSIRIDGSLQGYDGEFYRVDTAYGLLTLDGEGVICEGPGCPDLTAPLAVIRVMGSEEVGRALLPPLFAAFAERRGLEVVQTLDANGYQADVSDPITGKPLAKISFTAATPDETRAALLAGRAELGVSAISEPGLGARAIAMDALLPIVASGNTVAKISTADLAAALSGEITNWRALGGADMPIVLHALHSDDSTQQALAARLGRDVPAKEHHADLAALAAAVARDPWALAVTVQSAVGDARPLPLTDSCGFPLLATRLGIKAEDYPLSLPLYLVTPKRRLPLFAREFLEFLPLPEAQVAIQSTAYINRAPERQPMTADGLRLLNAIRGAGADVGLADLKRLADRMAGADRLSLTFRFEDGSSTLDAHSRENLAHFSQLLAVGAYRDMDVVLAGFSDGAGDAAANLALSQSRAESVAAALAAATPDLPEGQSPPRVEAFGEALPMACDTTAAGRRSNRRVEIWLRPATNSPAP